MKKCQGCGVKSAVHRTGDSRIAPSVYTICGTVSHVETERFQTAKAYQTDNAKNVS